MPTEDAYSSGHLVLSHFGTCMCSNVETNLSRTCLVSGLLNFEHPSVLLFCLSYQTIFGKKTINELIKVQHMEEQYSENCGELNTYLMSSRPVILFHLHIRRFYWDWPYNRLWLFTLLHEVSIGHLQRVWHANRGRLHLWTPGTVPRWDFHVF